MKNKVEFIIQHIKYPYKGGLGYVNEKILTRLKEKNRVFKKYSEAFDLCKILNALDKPNEYKVHIYKQQLSLNLRK